VKDSQEIKTKKVRQGNSPLHCFFGLAHRTVAVTSERFYARLTPEILLPAAAHHMESRPSKLCIQVKLYLVGDQKLLGMLDVRGADNGPDWWR
jgi:hypothetical protein